MIDIMRQEPEKKRKTKPPKKDDKDREQVRKSIKFIQSSVRE